MGKDNLPDFTPDKLPGTRFQLFKDVFFNRLGAIVKINLLVLAFGTVTSGMDVVDKILEDARPTDDNGTISKDSQPVIESITVTKEE